MTGVLTPTGHLWRPPILFRSNNGVFGLHDLHGNVWEWVEDCYHENYEGSPTDGAGWTANSDCTHRVVRGGSWRSDPKSLRAAGRGWNTTGYRGINLGFRVGRTLTSALPWKGRSSFRGSGLSIKKPVARIETRSGFIGG